MNWIFRFWDIDRIAERRTLIIQYLITDIVYWLCVCLKTSILSCLFDNIYFARQEQNGDYMGIYDVDLSWVQLYEAWERWLSRSFGELFQPLMIS